MNLAQARQMAMTLSQMLNIFLEETKPKNAQEGGKDAQGSTQQAGDVKSDGGGE